jgi:hypothetical protein
VSLIARLYWGLQWILGTNVIVLEEDLNKEKNASLDKEEEEKEPFDRTNSILLPTAERMALVEQGAQMLKLRDVGKPHHQFVQINQHTEQLLLYSAKSSQEDQKKPNTIGEFYTS